MRMSYFFIIVLSDFPKSCAYNGTDVRILGISSIPISGFKMLLPLGILIICFIWFLIECTSFTFSGILSAGNPSKVYSVIFAHNPIKISRKIVRETEMLSFVHFIILPVFYSVCSIKNTSCFCFHSSCFFAFILAIAFFFLPLLLFCHFFLKEEQFKNLGQLLLIRPKVHINPPSLKYLKGTYNIPKSAYRANSFPF